MEEQRGVRIQQATLSQREQIISLDESVIGSRCRAEQIRQGVADGLVYIITVKEEIAAFGLLSSHFYGRHFLELLIVKQEHRRKGLGKMLLRVIQEQCETESLFTSTNASNLPMQKLLEKCGFERCGWIDQLDEDDPEIVYCHQLKDLTNVQHDAELTIDSSVQIRPLTWGQLGAVNNKPNQPFLVIGRVKAAFADGQWMWTEEMFPTPYEKRYPDEQLDYSHYINSPDRCVFLAYLDRQCVGQIRLKRNWNRYGLIEDISVAKDYRNRGIGKQLLASAIEWAKAGGMPGLMLETQDINLVACRFYEKCGFQLGGVDVMLYGNLAEKNEQALFWYMQFGATKGDI
jgi:ribosomal protein S18 acetylase RimI-like enzyme